MSIDFIAMFEKKETFYASFVDGMEKILYNGVTLIFHAVGNRDLESMYDICNFLLDKKIDVTCVDKDQDSILHLLLSKKEHDINKTTSLCKRLIDSGADINALNKNKAVALKMMLFMKHTDEELEPLYDLWFSQPFVNLLTKDKWGLTPIDFAKRAPYRTKIVERMEKYVQEGKN